MSPITRSRDAAYWVHSQTDDDSSEAMPLPNLAGLEKLSKTACPGRDCNRAFWRAHPLAVDELRLQAVTADEDVPYVPDETVVRRALTALVPGSPVWCRPDADEIRSELGRLPDLAADCGRRRDGQLAPPPPSDRHGTRVAPPSPSPAWDQVAVIVEWAAAWADSLARHLQGADPAFYLRTGVPARTISRSVRYLQTNCTAALSAPFAKDIGVELFDLVQRSEKVAGVDELIHRLPAPCVQCGRKALQRKDGKERVECRACKTSWRWEDYERLGVAYRESGVKAVPASERRRLGSSNEGYGGPA